MFEKIVAIIKEELAMDGAAVITENTVLREDLDADSLNIVEIVMSLEDEFGIDLPDEEMESIKTVGDLEKYITNKL